MAEIQDIPYINAEDLNKYIYDSYQSTEMLEELTTQTGFTSASIFELEQNTGVTANSIAQIYYNLNYFNPLYAEAVWKCYMNDMTDCFAFFGFKETIGQPTYDMTESHAGFMVNNGKLYASVADGYSQQRVEIVGIDMKKVQEYKINYNSFSIRPLPIVEEVLGLPSVKSIERVWKEYTTLSDFPPKNQVHWIMQFIKNSTGEEKYIRFNKFIYREVYAD